MKLVDRRTGVAPFCKVDLSAISGRSPRSASFPPPPILSGPLMKLTGALAAAAILLGPLPNEYGIAYASPKLTAEEVSTVRLFQSATPAVVYITNIGLQRDTFTMNELEVPQGAGSGFVWDNTGHVVTNFHVIRGAKELMVTLTGGNDYKAKIVGLDADRDVAVLQINTEGKDTLKPLKRGTSSDLQVGQRVFAIGNPFGLDHTLTTGIISGIGREINSGNTGRPIQDVIQTDAAINPGNSGGPLLDSNGAVIGINTAIYSPVGVSSGVGFAIPIDIVQNSVQEIIANGKVVRPILGISFAPDQSVEQLGVTGVLVLDAKVGGPADKAGIRGTSRDEFGRLVLGDVILRVDQNKIKTASDLYKTLDKRKVGDELEIEVLRGDSTVSVHVTLEPST